MNIVSLLVIGLSLLTGVVAIVVSFFMLSITKKFGQGILGSGFKRIGLGVLLITGGLLIDALLTSLQTLDQIVFSLLAFGKYGFFIAGTYAIYLGSKRTSDQLEAFTKK